MNEALSPLASPPPSRAESRAPPIVVRQREGFRPSHDAKDALVSPASDRWRQRCDGPERGVGSRARSVGGPGRRLREVGTRKDGGEGPSMGAGGGGWHTAKQSRGDAQFS